MAERKGEAVIAAAAVEEKAAETQQGMDTEEDKKEPEFPALTAAQAAGGKFMKARVPVPPHRLTPLKQSWPEIYKPIVEHMKLQIRYNTKRKSVDLRTTKATESGAALTKAADFVRAFMLGFALKDAIALLRLDDLYIDSFEIKDVKELSGEHLSRAIGRIAGQGGKTKFTIENATKTRIVLADTHVHILGSFANIKTARSSIARLIMGAPPGKVYTAMRNVANRMKERF